MLTTALAVLGALSIVALFWRRYGKRRDNSGMNTVRQGSASPSRAQSRIERLEKIQVRSLVVGVAAVPGAFVVLLLTDSAALTITTAGVTALAGLVAGLCEVAKGFVEVGEMHGGDPRPRE